jgi:hypothetical protein
MNESHDVISAFLDDEPFDASELAAALSEPGGRELLIDFIALRHIVHTDGLALPAQPATMKRSLLRMLLPAAAVLVALAGGYVIGERSTQATSDDAPAATRVVEAPAEWRVLP